MDKRSLLLISNSTTFGENYLDHCIDAIRVALGPAEEVCFLPFAKRDHEAYGEAFSRRLQTAGLRARTVTPDGRGRELLTKADAVFVGGGNTYRLLSACQRLGFMELLKGGAAAGQVYVGSSAGVNLACPTIMTTNDMPILQPRGLAALGLVPFQINPHYTDSESRRHRLNDYLIENGGGVLCLREGAWLRVAGQVARLGGENGAVLLRARLPPEEFLSGDDLSDLL